MDASFSLGFHVLILSHQCFFTKLASRPIFTMKRGGAESTCTSLRNPWARLSREKTGPPHLAETIAGKMGRKNGVRLC